MNILYHYTTMSTFYNMIEHSLQYEDGDIHPKYITMWATHYAHQNDPTECQLFFKGLENSILNYARTNKIDITSSDKKLIQQPWYGLNLFTISFSKQEDDLTMWRGYGQNGDGISLGFDFPNFHHHCHYMEQTAKNENTGVKVTLYIYASKILISVTI